MVRLVDIAKNVGVSTAAVSYVLGGKGKACRIPGKTCQQIIAEAQRLGYHKNNLGVQLQSGHSRQIVFLSHQFNYEFASGIYTGLSAYCTQAGYSCQMLDSSQNQGASKSKIRSFYSKLLESRPEGLIFYYKEHFGEDFIQKCHDMNIPVCVVDNRDYEEDADLLVYANTKDGAAQAVRYLYEHGHRQIGLCYSCYAYANPIREGFENQIRQYGLSCPSEWLISFDEMDKNDEKYFAKFRNLMVSRHLPTAFCFASDFAAVNLFLYFLRNGLRVPEDISIIGFGGLTFAKALRPALTTVCKNYYEIGSHAAEALLGMLDKKEAKHDNIVLPCHIQEGETVKNMIPEKGGMPQI